MYRNVGTFAGALVGLGLSLLVTNCSSSDLGDAKPDSVKVDLTLAGWDSGAGAVIAMKCANCHTAERSDFVPSNTPRILDGIKSKEFFLEPANISLIRAMRKRIESDDTLKQMPPKFATPLMGDEKIAVISFLKSVEDQSLTGTVNPDCKAKLGLQGAKPFNLLRRNGDDNGDDDTPPLNPSPSPSATPLPSPPVSDPCNPSANNKPTSETSPPASGSPPPQGPVLFADIEGIVVATCAKSGCHTGAAGAEFVLKAESDLLRVKSLALSEITSGGMPRGDAAWRYSEDGKRVIAWLSQ